MQGGVVRYNYAPYRDNGYMVGTVAAVYCNPGFTRHGSFTTECKNSGNWSPTFPECRLGNKVFCFK